MKEKTVVISGINIIEAGPKSIMTDFLKELGSLNDPNLRILALVNSKKLFNVQNIEYVEFPESKKSWFNRLYHEYWYFKKFSKELKADYWISMHDMTPNVVCKNLYVYCHNATPYYWPSLKDWRYGGRASVFSLFYIFLYGINIKKNKGVIVQQEWLRERFSKRFGIKNIIVAYPDVEELKAKIAPIKTKNPGPTKKLIYPSFPRSFKNFEVICEAYKNLSGPDQEKIEIFLTLNQEMNPYADYIITKYQHLKGIKFVGRLTREEVFDYYNEVDALLFPSKLESWGLPITEFKNFNKPIFLADLPYARETLGGYELGYFFNPGKSAQLTKLLEALINGSLQPIAREEKLPAAPFFVGWKNLFEHIIAND